MSWLTAILGHLAAALGWVVLAVAVAAAVAVSVFRAILPSWVAPVVIVALGAAFVASNAARTSEIAQLKTERAETAAQHAATLKAIADQTADAERQYRAAEQAWRTSIEKEAQDGQARLDLARADAGRAHAAADGLRQQLAAYRRAATGAAANPGPAPAGPPAADAIGLLADLLGQLDDRAGIYAAAADAAHAAGLTCERAYDSLAARKTAPQ